jgi:hypothetical protein
MFPDLKGRAEGAWGWRAFMDPFSKKANIPCLRWARNACALSERAMTLAIGDVDHVKECPWLVGATFETDGKQLKLVLISSERSNASIPGLRHLNKAGYQVSSSDVPLSEMLARGNGVWRLEHVVGDVSLDSADTTVTAVDPGQAHPIHLVRAGGDVWAGDRSELVLGSHRVEEVFVTEAQYADWCGRKQWQDHEDMRRRSPYGAALYALLGKRRRTLASEEFLEYCKTFALHEETIYEELLTVKRRSLRFARFRRVTSAVEKVAEAIAPMCDKGKGRRFVCFGAATFRSQKGRASAPLKKLVRALAQRAVTVMTPEGGTSKYCPTRECHAELVRDEEDIRTRHCPNELCPLHTTPFNRDAGGSTGIGGVAYDAIEGLAAQIGLNADDFDVLSDVDDSTDVDSVVSE